MESLPYAYYSSNDDEFRLFALGKEDQLIFENQADFSKLDRFIAKHKGHYLFACLSYDLKNQLEGKASSKTDEMQFPKLIIWKPKLVVQLMQDFYKIIHGHITEALDEELTEVIRLIQQPREDLPQCKFTARTPKKDYLRHVRNIQNEIQLGNAYEVNFCQEYYMKDAPAFESWALMNELNAATKAPFSAYLKLEDFEVFCGSPERFLQRNGSKLLSQPIKGTSRRGHSKAEDEELKKKLLNDPKERAENMMITDLVRNDFSRIAQKNSVAVDELCALYTFETVHQLISTISCELKPDVPFSEILKATFPMGSMTGAPKISAMDIIDREEDFQRGLYSGSIGYFKPNGDFDFNVVIRSLLYNRKKNYLSCAVGGAITIHSQPEKEYEECLTKVGKIMQLFENDRPASHSL